MANWSGANTQGKRTKPIGDNPTSFLQSLFEQSSTQQHELGTTRLLSDGREYVYGKAGGANIAVGVLCQSAVVDLANVANIAVANAANANATSIDITMGDSTLANSNNALKEGFIYINTGAGAGHMYKIRGHSAIAANANGTIELYDKLRANVSNANSKASLVLHPYSGVIIHPSPPTSGLVGVTVVALTANYYGWFQRKGPACVLIDGSAVAGQGVRFSDGVDGAVEPRAANTDVEEPLIGVVIANNANTHYGLVDLNIS